MLLRNPFTRDARVLREARSLAGAGHEVTVLALRTPGTAPREQRDGFTIVRAVGGRFAGPTIAGASDGAVSSGRRARRRPAAAVWLRDEVISRRMAAEARRLPADVYHAHDLPMLRAAVVAAAATGARLVYDAHELYPELTGFSAGERARWARLEGRLIRLPDAVVVPSGARAEEFVRLYGIGRPTVVMNCPPAPGSVDAAASPLAAMRRPGELLAVYAGGFTPNRGIDNLIRAAASSEGIRLALYGWGPLEPSLRALVSSLPAATEHIAFCGAIEPDEVVAVVAGADVGCAPYIPIGRNNELAAPNKLFEYLHAGLAVAASDLPDVARVVREHDVGELFDAADAGSIAAALGRMREPARLAAARENARRAAPLYTWESQARELLGLYERLALERGATPSSGR